MYSRHTLSSARIAAIFFFANAAGFIYGQSSSTVVAAKATSLAKTTSTRVSTTGRPADLIEHLTQQMERAPDDWQVQNKLAVEYAKMGEYELALPLLDSAAGLQPQNANIYYNRAVVYERLNRLADALASIQRSISLDAAVPGARRMACDLQFELTNYEESAKCYGALNEEKEADAQFYASYASALAYARDIKHSFKVVEEGLSKYSGDTRIINSRGIANFMKKDYRRAADDFEQVINLDQSAGKVRFNLAIALLMSNDRAAALDQYRLLKETDPEAARQLRDAMDRRFVVAVEDTRKSKTALK